MKAKDELKSLNIQYTAQREAILNVFKNSAIPLTLNQLIDILELDVDLSTIYRTLELFEHKGLVSKTLLQEPLQNIYDYNRQIHRHHVVCVVCQEILIVDHCPLKEYERKVMASTGYIIEHHQLDLYGICPNCQQNHK